MAGFLVLAPILKAIQRVRLCILFLPCYLRQSTLGPLGSFCVLRLFLGGAVPAWCRPPVLVVLVVVVEEDMVASDLSLVLRRLVVLSATVSEGAVAATVLGATIAADADCISSETGGIGDNVIGNSTVDKFEVLHSSSEGNMLC